MKRLVAAAVAAAALTVTAAPQASATTGGVICNSLNSKHNLWVSAYRPARAQVMVPIGRCSYHVGVMNVQAFLSGWDMRSPWNYIYDGGQWHYVAYNGTRFTVVVLP